MLRVELRAAGLPSVVVLGSQETLVFGRAPDANLPEAEPDAYLHVTTLALPNSTPHTSRVLGELVVGDDIVRLHWHGSTEAQLASLFDAPGGARRVTLMQGMSALLDEGDNAVTVLRGRQGLTPDQFVDLTLDVSVRALDESVGTSTPGTEHNIPAGGAAAVTAACERARIPPPDPRR